jgi:N-methylhydantoinase A/oxoprolinase/acetone carboxylase beta subunit
MAWRIGVDIGGTFTDFALLEGSKKNLDRAKRSHGKANRNADQNAKSEPDPDTHKTGEDIARQCAIVQQRNDCLNSGEWGGE